MRAENARLIALLREDAIELGCLPEIAGLRQILERGTSAHRQLRIFERALQSGADPQEAFSAVVDWLVAETAR